MTEVKAKAVIYYRNKIEINTDPQRRCYKGCPASSELVWTSWTPLETVTAERVARRCQFWRELNDYAVSQRGEKARSEFKVEFNPHKE